MSNTFLLGRQPILDREEKVFAYGLVFRSAESPRQTTDNGTFPTADLIIELLSEVAAQGVLGQFQGAVNIGPELLMDDLMATLPAKRFILVLDRNPPATDEMIDRCRRLKESGFTLALGDHPFRPEYAEIYQSFDIIGINVKHTPADLIQASIQQFRRHPVRLLAEHVETRDEFAAYLSQGFELFQGLFFTKPTVNARKKLTEIAATLLRLVLLIINDSGVEAIVRTVQESPSVTYKLLLQANSVVVGARQEINSVRHAIMLLGRDRIRRWALFELLVANGGSQERNNPLFTMAMARSVFMEYLSESHPLLGGGSDAVDRACLVSVLSMMETIYNVSIEDVVKEVVLAADLKMALLQRAGLLGDMLSFVEALERLDFATAGKMLPKLQLSPARILEAQRRSLLKNSGGASNDLMI